MRRGVVGFLRGRDLVEVVEPEFPVDREPRGVGRLILHARFHVGVIQGGSVRTGDGAVNASRREVIGAIVEAVAGELDEDIVGGEVVVRGLAVESGRVVAAGAVGFHRGIVPGLDAIIMIPQLRASFYRRPFPTGTLPGKPYRFPL